MASDFHSDARTRQERIVEFMVRAQGYLAAYGMGDGRHRERLAMLANQMGLTPAEFDQAAALLLNPTSSFEDEEDLVPAEPVVDNWSARSRIEKLVPVADLARFAQQARLVMAHRSQWDQTLMVTLHSLADDHLIPHEVRPELFQLLRDPTYEPPAEVGPPAAKSVASPEAPGDVAIDAEVVEDDPAPPPKRKKSRRSKRPIPRWAGDPSEPVAPPVERDFLADMAASAEQVTGGTSESSGSGSPEIRPDPRKPRRAPQEVYREYLAKALAEIKSGRVNPRRERRLIAEGTDKLGLAAVLAEQLLHEAVEAAGLVLVSSRDQWQEDPGRRQKITRFQERAAEIIARQGGVTSIARTMIAEVADELKLDQAQRDEALAQIQRQADDHREEVQLRQRTESFREFVREKLQAVEQGIVLAKLAKQLTRLGSDLHGLEEDAARRVLREEATAAGLMLVSEDQAKDHLTDHVDDILEEEGFLSTEARQRVIAEGRQWGLPSAAILQLMEDRTEKLGQRQAVGRRRTNLVVAALFLVGFSAIGFVAYRELTKPTPEPTDFAAVIEPSQSSEDDPGRWQRQPWWGEPLTLDLIDLRQQDPRLTTAMDRIGSDKPATRARGYRELVPPLVKAIGTSGSEHSKLVRRRVLQGLYLREPDDEAAAALADAMIDPLPEDRDKPTKPSQFREQFERVLLATWLMTADGLDAAQAEATPLNAARLDSVRLPLERKLGVVFSAGTGAAGSAMGATAVGEFARIQYRHLRELATRDGDQAARMHLALADAASEYVTQEILIPLDANLVAEVLPRLTRDFAFYRPLVERTINTNQPAYLLPLVDMYERGEGASADIRKELAVLFSVKTGVTIDGMSAEEGGRAIRRGLGLHSAAFDQDSRQRIYLARSSSIELKPAKPLQPQEALADTLSLAHLATMGQAAAVGGSGQRAFQKLADEDPPTLSSTPEEPESEAKPSTPRRDPLGGQLRDFVRTLPKMSDARQRFSNFETISRMVSDVEDIDDQTADRLVEYLTMPKARDEQTAILVNLNSFAHWPALKLALADEVETVRRSREDLLELVSALVDGPVNLSQRGEWRTELRGILLSATLAQLPRLEVKQTVFSPALLDNAANQLAELYRQRGALVGLTDSGNPSEDGPAVCLGRLIDQELAQLRGQQLSETLSQQVNEARHLRVALSALGENEIAETVALQRVWLRLLAIGIEAKHPSKQPDLEELLAKLDAEDQASGDIFTQLRVGEAALVKLWELAVKT